MLTLLGDRQPLLYNQFVLHFYNTSASPLYIIYSSISFKKTKSKVYFKQKVLKLAYILLKLGLQTRLFKQYNLYFYVQRLVSNNNTYCNPTNNNRRQTTSSIYLAYPTLLQYQRLPFSILSVVLLVLKRQNLKCALSRRY